jgi:hypothetical protein
VGRDKEYYKLIMGTIHAEYITNTYALSIRALNFMKQILLDIKRETGHSTVIVHDFNIPFSPIAHQDKKATKKIKIKLHYRSNGLNGTYKIFNSYTPHILFNQLMEFFPQNT